MGKKKQEEVEKAGKKAFMPEDVILRRRLALRNRGDMTAFFGRLTFLLLFIYILFFRILGLALVANDDMKPKLYGGDLILYYRLAKEWYAQDLIYYEKDGQNYVGRLVAAAGDRVNITEDGKVIVNGNTLLEDEIFYANKLYQSGVSFPLTLQKGEFFVLGDYREGAKDSRYFGPVKKKEIIGKIISAIRRKGL